LLSHINSTSFSFPQTKTTSYSNTLNIIFASIFFTCLIVFNMIANLSTILYIMSVSEQVLSNKILQKGTVACKLNSAGDILNIQFTFWLPNNHKKSEESEEDCHVQKIKSDTVCFLTGKFAMLPNGSLELVVSSCKTYKLKKTKCPSVSPLFIYWGK
jgi:predicted membrane protein